jgi:hypothetical protein
VETWVALKKAEGKSQQQGGFGMRKVFFGTMVAALFIAVAVPVIAQVNVNINVGTPPPVTFAGPPQLVVLPETYVYVVPDVETDIFFYNGWWWRPWNGRWYRSRHYNSGWVHYKKAPSFYASVPPGWRNDYREHRWKGRHWVYEPIPHHHAEKNWSNWQKHRYWEEHGAWGVQGLERRKPGPPPKPGGPRPGPDGENPKPRPPEKVERPKPGGPPPKPQAERPKPGGPRPGPDGENPKPRTPEKAQRPQKEPRDQQSGDAQPQGKPEGKGQEHRK